MCEIQRFKNCNVIIFVKYTHKDLFMKQQQERIKKTISLIKTTDMIEKFLNKHIAKELSGYQIPDEYMPNSEISATIEYAESVDFHTIKPDFDKIISYGDDNIGIPITFQLGADTELLVPKYRTYELIETHKMTFKERNKGFLETHQNALLDISATLIVDMSCINIDAMEIKIDSVKFNENCKVFKCL